MLGIGWIWDTSEIIQKETLGWVGISFSQGELKMKVVLEMQFITIIVKCSHKHDTRALVSTRSTLPLVD